MSDPFYAEIRMWALSYAPKNWAYCNGQFLDIAQYGALFALLGVTYGGDARTNFALPNLMARRPVGVGKAPGSHTLKLGYRGGYETIPLITEQMPSHSHTWKGSTTHGSTGVPASRSYLSAVKGVYSSTATNEVSMHSDSIGMTGDGIPHENRSPYLVVAFCIALTGFWPSRP